MTARFSVPFYNKETSASEFERRVRRVGFPVCPLDVTIAKMPKPAAENARNDEPTAKKEHEDRVKNKQGQGVALGDKQGLALQHKDDDKRKTGIGTTCGWLGDSFWMNDDMRANKNTSMSSSGTDKLKGDAEGPMKRSGQQLKVRGTSSCPAESEPSALSALQLLAKGIRTECALSPSEWAAVSKANIDPMWTPIWIPV